MSAQQSLVQQFHFKKWLLQLHCGKNVAPPSAQSITTKVKVTATSQ